MMKRRKGKEFDFLENEWIECLCGNSERLDTTPSYCTVCGRDFDGSEKIYRGRYPRGWNEEE